MKRLNNYRLDEQSLLYLSVANMQKGSSLYQVDMKSNQVLHEEVYRDGGANQLHYGLDKLSSKQSNTNTHEEKSENTGTQEFEMISCSFYENLLSTFSVSFPV